MTQSLPSYPGGALASSFTIVSAMANYCVPEGILLDGKLKLTSRSEFLKDVASMANAQGGVLVIGAKQEEEHGKWTMMGLEHVERERQKARDYLMYLAAPGVPDLSIEVVKYGTSDFVVVQVPRSYYSPVCFTEDDHVKFWIRDRDRCRGMSLAEIEVAFRLRNKRSQRLQAHSGSLRRRFEEAPFPLRQVRVSLLIGELSDSDVQWLTERFATAGGLATRSWCLSDPLILKYDEGLASTFGAIPESWVYTNESGKPDRIRLPGSSLMAVFEGPDPKATQDFIALCEEAGRLLKPRLVDCLRFRLISSELFPKTFNPECLWLLYLATECAFLPNGDPLRCHIDSWLRNANFDYPILLREFSTPPFSHLALPDEFRDAAIRRLRITLPGDVCMLSSVALTCFGIAD